MGPISVRLSYEQTLVVPKVAETKKGIKPLDLSSSMAFCKASPRILNAPSTGIFLQITAPNNAALSPHECAYLNKR